MRDFGRWEEAGVPGENPRIHGENMQTPHREAPAGSWTWNPLTVRRRSWSPHHRTQKHIKLDFIWHHNTVDEDLNIKTSQTLFFFLTKKWTKGLNVTLSFLWSSVDLHDGLLPVLFFLLLQGTCFSVPDAPLSHTRTHSHSDMKSVNSNWWQSNFIEQFLHSDYTSSITTAASVCAGALLPLSLLHLSVCLSVTSCWYCQQCDLTESLQ